MSDVEKSEISYDSQLDAFELYHLIVEDSRQPSTRNGGPALPALGHALAGSVATATSKLLIYPLDLVIARLQVQKQIRQSQDGSEYKGLLDAATKIYKHEGGLNAFYTGCAADVGKGIADSFIFFLAYTFLQQRELHKAKTNKKQLSVAKEMLIGIVAGAFSKLITTPLQNIITRQQTAALLKAKDTKNDDSLKQGDAMTISDIAKQIYKERGLSGFWAGYSMSLILTLNPAITFAVDNFLQKATPVSAGAHVTFLIAAVSKAVATSITYPVSVAKSRAQAMPHPEIATSEGTDKKAAKPRLLRLLYAQYAVLLSLQKIYQQDGLTGLYSGLEGEVLKGFLSHGLTMMLKDRVHGSIIEMYYFLLKVTSQWPAELRKAQALTASVVVDARRRVENVGETVAEGGKQAIEEVGAAGQNAIEGLRSAGAAVADGANLENASQRAGNIGVTVAEAGKHVLQDAGERAGNVGTTLVEGLKHALGDAPQRVGNVGTTVVEGVRHAVENTSQHAENVGVTVLEGGKHAATELQNAGMPYAVDAGTRVENVSVTVAEAGRQALENAGSASKHAVDQVKKVNS
ncbi:hypothetical protein AMS68_001085 [Peltaster fructicola]|uniref:Peroxisomal adenine nucleotide transporter 1 n=1 Tax=Peltaster fructicola TaxID=286661 RepID=A0A6H0XLS0_9PEZI|nr:hypothetical protein AMS68_001085 [Peltaster fructicola]